MLEPGRVLGHRYEILKEIGSGGMANVYKARDQKLDRLVAIKVLKQEFTFDETILNKFRKEALAAGSLNHPNIVAVYDLGHELDSEYIVMEYIDGITLKEYIRRRDQLTSDEILKISIHIAEALKVAHEHGIIHRDIKPQNIMVTPSGEVKVTDFGIAKAVSSNTVTASGETLGSVHYFSPEQARGVEVDARSDLYSLGITMYEMATRKLPFTADTPMGVAMKQLNTPLPDPWTLSPGLWPGLRDVILKLTQKLPANRYQSAEDLIVDLKRIYRDHSLRIPLTAGASSMGAAASRGNASPEGASTRYGGAADARNTQQEREARMREARMRERQAMERDKQRKKHRNRLMLLIIAIVVLAIALTVILVMLLRDPSGSGSHSSQLSGIESSLDSASGTSESSDTSSSESSSESSEESSEETVPDVTKITYEEAQSQLSQQNLYYSVIAQNDENVEAGYVISQNPAAGEAVPSDRTITLYVSLGPASTNVTVPSLYGMTQEEAQQALEAVGLKLGEVSTSNSSTVEKDLVIRQSVEAETSVAKGTSVDVTISLGASSNSSSTTSAGSIVITQPFSQAGTTGALIVTAFDASGNATELYNGLISYETFAQLGGSLKLDYPAGTVSIRALLDGNVILDETVQ